MSAPAIKAVVVISGGCLRSVFSDGPLEVTLLDQDNIEDAGEDEHNDFDAQLEDATHNMTEVW